MGNGSVNGGNGSVNGGNGSVNGGNALYALLGLRFSMSKSLKSI